MILIIDDEENIRATLFDIFTAFGYRVELAATCIEGIDKAKNLKPELILLDTKLPDCNGIDVCREIKQKLKLPAKIIVYTGKIDAIDAVEARRAGADDFCVKGTDPSMLIEAVKKLI